LCLPQTNAQQYWLNRDPIGARIEIKGGDGGPAEVIGVARNSKYGRASMVDPNVTLRS
jgi:hypothetical protein